MNEELHGPTVSAFRRAIAEVKQRWSVIGWVTKIFLSLAPPCFGRHVKPLVPAAFAVVGTYQPALGRGGLYGPLFLCVIHKEGLYPSSGDINRLMMMMMKCKETFVVQATARRRQRSGREATARSRTRPRRNTALPVHPARAPPRAACAAVRTP
jgi:hypothetical protein